MNEKKELVLSLVKMFWATDNEDLQDKIVKAIYTELKKEEK